MIVRHVLIPKSPNFFGPTRKSVSNILNNPYEEIYDEEIDDSDIEISEFPIIARLPQPYNPQMPKPNGTNL